MLFLSVVKGLQSCPVWEGVALGEVGDGLVELDLSGHREVQLLRLLVLRNVVMLFNPLPPRIDKPKILEQNQDYSRQTE